MNRLNELLSRGQSVWLDNIQRRMLESGELDRLILAGLRGMTSNPSIFDKAISTGVEYDKPIRKLLGQRKSVDQIVDILSLEDIQAAADAFAPVYAQSDGADGFVSIEVSPVYARNADRTLQEARRLWSQADRPNVMVKIPATREGLPAIYQCLADGIPINVTLIFSLERYREVMDVYRRALETRAREKKTPRVAGVASFFVSRIDTAVDKRIQEKIQSSKSAEEKDRLLELLGKTAVASAKAAYALHREFFAGPWWDSLVQLGAIPQRPLWASTSVKNPHYPDLLYVDSLIGAGTVNTLPPATLDAFLDHGAVSDSLPRGAAEARAVPEKLRAVGIDLRRVTQELEDEGVALFIEAHEKLLAGLRAKKDALLSVGK